MSDMFTVELRSDDGTIDLPAIEEEIRSLDGVGAAGTLDARSLDPATVGMWVQVVGAGLGVVAAAVPVVDKIAAIVRRRGIKKATLRFEGGELDLDNVSVSDLERLLTAAKSPPAG